MSYTNSLSHPSNSVLMPGEIDIWRVNFKRQYGQLENIHEILSQEEKIRSEKYHFAMDKSRFVLGRGILRILLSRYLNLHPKSFKFEYGCYGKLFLVFNQSDIPIRFNLSHSDSTALYIFTSNREIGIDIERIKDFTERDHVARNIFTNQERALYLSLPENRRKEMFFTCWTRKEAYLKAIGKGLIQPPNKLNICSGEEELRSSSIISTHSQPNSKYYTQNISVADGFAAAFAIELGNA